MSAIISKDSISMQYDPSKKYPDNWEDDTWIAVPEHLEEKLLDYAPSFKPIFNSDKTEVLDIEKEEYEIREEIDLTPTRQESITYFSKFIIDKYRNEMTDIDKLYLYNLFEYWAPKQYNVQDIVNYNQQTFECIKAHNSLEDSNINPNNPNIWFEYWAPLHGKTLDTARQWIDPIKENMIYKRGEYVHCDDNIIYKCIFDTKTPPSEIDDRDLGDWEQAFDMNVEGFNKRFLI